mgnify:CR=1 FL=1|jgi:hypothetical protein
MSTITIDIGADVEDTYFKNEQEWMCRIVDAAHKFDTVFITMKEGTALEELNFRGKKFLQILKELCDSNQWEQEKFKFELPNLTQNLAVWPEIEISVITHHFQSIQNKSYSLDKSIEKTFGMFVGRSSWDRLLLASYLLQHHQNITKQTYRNYLDNPASMIGLDLDRMCWQVSSSGRLDITLIRSVMNLVSSMPILLNDTHKNVTHLQWNEGAVGADILGWYNSIFVDIVCEKMVTGQTFFPTEKTARPLATKTPFLIMSSPNYIKNLRRLGFRSFEQFWDESYDYQQGVQRIVSMQKIIDNVAKLDNQELENMYQKMLPILEHNYKTYHELTVNKITSTFL